MTQYVIKTISSFLIAVLAHTVFKKSLPDFSLYRFAALGLLIWVQNCKYLMARIVLSAEQPELDHIFMWCQEHGIDMYYGRLWRDNHTEFGWQIVLEDSPKISWLLLQWSPWITVSQL